MKKSVCFFSIHFTDNIAEMTGCHFVDNNYQIPIFYVQLFVKSVCLNKNY